MMIQDTKTALAAFNQKAMQRLQDNKVPKRQRLYVPSIDQEVTIRSLSYDEIVECLTVEDAGDPNRSDKYSIYMSMVEPNLKEAAQQMKASQAGDPPEQRAILEPMDIVGVFPLSEIHELAQRVMELSGVTSSKKVTVVKELKNG